MQLEYFCTLKEVAEQLDLDGAGRSIERSALEKFKLALIAKGFDEDEMPSSWSSSVALSEIKKGP